jgi:hypothetical protein
MKTYPKDKVNVAFIGVSNRGLGLLKMVLDSMEDVNITAVCDLYADRTEMAKKTVTEKRGTVPFATQDYMEILKRDDVDAVITPSSWESHLDIVINAMNAGKYAACEVGGANSLDQCWELVKTYERTKTPAMILENCCYGKTEMMILNMVKKGIFGELIHAEGGYEHDLRKEVAMGNENRHYRLNNYKNRNGELYPTHELGPISKWLSINRGNRMLTLCSMASKSRGINEWIQTRKGPDYENAGYDFAEGDVVTTMIKCAHGETILLIHDTSLPRPYSRGNRLQGTKAIWLEDKMSLFIDGVSPSAGWDHSWETFEKYYEQYEHPLWKWYREKGLVGGHDGMDYLSMRGFIEAVKSGTQTPIDVYDMAAWMSITCLSEESVAMGGHPVAIPDFTNGRWINREQVQEGRYCLEKICPDDCYKL